MDLTVAGKSFSRISWWHFSRLRWRSTSWEAHTSVGLS